MNNLIKEEKIRGFIKLYENQQYDNLINGIKIELKSIDNPILYNLLGAALINKNDLIEAENNFKILIDKFSDYIDGFINLMFTKR